MKKFFSILLLFAFVLSSSDADAQAASVGRRIVGRTVAKKAGSNIAENTAKKLANNSVKSYAKNSTEYAIVQRVAKDQIKRNINRQMLQTGTKSFFDYSKNRLKTIGEKSFVIITNSKTIGARRATSILNEKGITTTTKVAKRSFARDVVGQEMKQQIKYVARKEGQEAAEEISKRYSRNKSIKSLFKKWEKDNADIVVNTSENGWTKVSYKSDKFCTAEFSPDGKTIKCTSGSVIDDVHPKGGPQNAFLNNPLPNKTYVVDNASVYKTNAKGQTTQITSDVTQLYRENAAIRGGRPQYGDILDANGGNRAIHDAGHGVGKALGGPNEAINITPQLKSTNRGGAWKKMENDMLDAVSKGKDVKYDLRISYDKSGVPREYTARVMIDGKPYKQAGKHVLVFPNI